MHASFVLNCDTNLDHISEVLIMCVSLCHIVGADCLAHGQVTNIDGTGQVRIYTPSVIRAMQKHLGSSEEELGGPLENLVLVAFSSLSFVLTFACFLTLTCSLSNLLAYSPLDV